ncbi:MAG: endo alpha-1,4 polygalactosaminidase [Hyphomicrobiaceae bacterium]
MRSPTSPHGAPPAGGQPRIGLLSRAFIGLLALVAMTGFGVFLMHTSIDPAEERDAAHLPAVRSEALADVRSWGYQLQGLNIAEAARSGHDLLVVDESLPGAGPPQRRAALNAMKRKPDGGRRIVLAYLSIGEAESYRAYWQGGWTRLSTDLPRGDRRTEMLPLGSPAAAAQPQEPASKVAPARVPTTAAPAWLGRENPEWRGNFSVRFWDPGWQSLLSGSETAALDRLIAAGFDGVYLDRADTYTQWSSEHPDAKAAMVTLVTHLSAYAKAKNPDFLVALQNAEELLETRKVRGALDLVAKEDLLFGIAGTGAANSERDVAASLGYLKKAQTDGLPVLVVEYLEPGPAADATRKALEQHGFIAHFAPRLLNQLRAR